MAVTCKSAKSTPPATTAGKSLLEPHEIVMTPTIQSAIGIQAWSKFAGEADLGGLVKDLRQVVEKVQDGNMKPVEAMLYGQAMTLQTIFTSLSRRATSQEYMTQFQAYLSLALKAQAQCRATLEALAEVKNPRPVAFVKQANIAHGPQQVNNGIPAPRAQENECEPNKLSEVGNELLPDTRASGGECCTLPTVPALGEVHRTTD